jgi:hypothetical protein
MQHCTIVIEIDPLSEPICGTAGDGFGKPQVFVGYARLVAAIEARLAAARSAVMPSQTASPSAKED